MQVPARKQQTHRMQTGNSCVHHMQTNTELTTHRGKRSTLAVTEVCSIACASDASRRCTSLLMAAKALTLTEAAQHTARHSTACHQYSSSAQHSTA
jgi:hypothetical protein